MTWHLQLDNPNFLGWSVVAAYVFAAVSCAWVALKMNKSAFDGSKIWWLLAVVLLFLGINKQLNLQTLMIDIGRYIARDSGWYGRRRLVQTIFAVGFALLGLGLLWFFVARAKHFIVENRLAFAGVIVLLLFVVLRAVTINHVNEPFGVDLKDEHWGWVLEICGSVLIILSAVVRNKSKA